MIARQPSTLGRKRTLASPRRAGPAPMSAIGHKWSRRKPADQRNAKGSRPDCCGEQEHDCRCREGPKPTAATGSVITLRTFSPRRSNAPSCSLLRVVIHGASMSYVSGRRASPGNALQGHGLAGTGQDALCAPHRYRWNDCSLEASRRWYASNCQRRARHGISPGPRNHRRQYSHF